MNCKHPKEFVIKIGVRFNTYKTTQRYHCKKCNTKFSSKTKYSPCKFPDEVIEEAIKLVKSGSSLRETVQQIKKKYSINLTYNAVFLWMKKYARDFNIPHSRPLKQETKRKISISLRSRNKK